LCGSFDPICSHGSIERSDDRVTPSSKNLERSRASASETKPTAY